MLVSTIPLSKPKLGEGNTVSFTRRDARGQ